MLSTLKWLTGATILITLAFDVDSSSLGKLRVFGARKRHHKPKHHHIHTSSPLSTKEPGTTLIDSEIETEVGTVADAFAPLIQDNDTEKSASRPDIDIPQLLKACHTFHRQMERVGQGQSSRDLASNIHKVQALYQKAPLEQRDSMVGLLQYERSLNIHPPPGTNVLHDPSGAIGLLWIRRSLAFQTAWYRRLLSDATTNVMDAAKDAYRQELQPFHGYLLQNVFLNVGIPAMTPPRHQLLARLGGFVEETMSMMQQRATERDLQRLVHIWDPLVTKWTTIMKDLEMEDLRRI